MNVRKLSHLIALLTLSLVIFVSCSERSSATKDTRDEIPRSGSFLWVGSSVIYDTIAAKKPVSMMIVSTPWCQWCDTLHEKTLRDSTVMGMIDAWFNACIIDADSDSLIVVGDSLVSCHVASHDVFKVKGYPMTIFFNHNGAISVPCLGYYGPEQYADILYGAYDALKDK
jgi:thioredoxin-related protein